MIRPGGLSPQAKSQRIEGGFPHSEIPGSKLVRSSPRLIAAYHVLHRLSAPRHPPNALKALDRFRDRCPFFVTRSLRIQRKNLTRSQKDQRQDRFRSRRRMLAEHDREQSAFAPPSATFPLHDVQSLRTRPILTRTAPRQTDIQIEARHHGPWNRRRRSRTAPRPREMVEPDGIEPTT